VIGLDDIIDRIDDSLDCEGEITEEIATLIYKELRDLNFGSMEYDW
jgi:hypothetical protein